MCTYQQALDEKELNLTIKDFLSKIELKLEADPDLSHEAALNYLVSLIIEKEGEYVRENAIKTRNYTLNINWDTLDFRYYIMVLRIMSVEKYNAPERLGVDKLEVEKVSLKNKCREAYTRHLNEIGVLSK